MNCPYCGESINDDAVFCGACGMKIQNPAVQNIPAAPAPEKAPEAPAETKAEPSPAPAAQEVPAPVSQEAPAPAPQPAPKTSAGDIAKQAKAAGKTAVDKANAAADTAAAAVSKVVPGFNKTILFIAAGALVLIIIAVIILVNVLGSRPAYDSLNTYTYAASNDGELTAFINGKRYDTDIKYNGSSITYLDRLSVAYYDESLYNVKDGKLVELDEKANVCALSSQLNALVYIVDNDLILLKDGKKTTLLDFTKLRLDRAAPSPNGTTVLFTIRDNGDSVCYSYKSGGKSVELADDYIPYAVSDDGSIAYVAKDENLYLMKNLKADNTTKISGKFAGVYSVSKDGKKILFGVSGKGTYYFDPSLEEPIKVSGDRVTPIFPNGPYVPLLDNFNSFLALSNDKIQRFVRKGDGFEKFTVVGDYSDYQLSSDGKTLVYLKNDKLQKINTVSESAEPTLLASDIKSFKADLSLSKVFAVNDDNELVYCQGAGKTVKVADDIKSYTISMSGTCVYIDDDYRACWSNGAKGVKAEKMTDCKNLTCDGKTFYVWNDDVLYRSANGQTFENTKIEK